MPVKMGRRTSLPVRAVASVLVLTVCASSVRWLVSAPPFVVAAPSKVQLAPASLRPLASPSREAHSKRIRHHRGRERLRTAPWFGRESAVIFAATMLAATARALSWLPTGSQQPPPFERLSAREWARLYRLLGLPEDASRERVMRATSRLRKKYGTDQEKLERIENASLWIVTRFISREEEATRKRQQAARLRELGDSPRRMLSKLVLGFLPQGVHSMLEAPSAEYFRTVSSLLGVFALLGLCVPTQSSNFVGLATATTMGLVYQRNRPAPVKDEFGNPGAVQKINYQEAAGAVVVAALGLALGAGAAAGLDFYTGAPFQAVFCISACGALWLVALLFKVYGCFDSQAE